ncbi:MAG: haloacid dehalogenase superfamily protein, subfamily IA, variant 3 with third motif having DD or ED [Solidesulfovibrio magneticus str. Maddingley MBC34]|uniref:Haloacid dehalogenase superfamily protein, subfamily IA, variant 3 with third motif having DD or ED n=1 Tax=Solidesulfovibrio magneticus str. Maddingley MBC34 TaxID=1206767 RepID=K6GHC2_9BACT|nr:MAG: haloacid dehalogenase superfamily protein, subfamily IA, variant 3 with third motif having DD or ED [Solidesulfovibrio magneticus str. Maddingley MBC34]
MPRICVIFDLDGTLVDSEGLCNQAFIDLIPPLTETVDSLTKRYRGKKLAQILADLEERYCLDLPDEFVVRYRQRVAELFSRELKPIPGVLDMLERTDFPKCIASSGPLLKIHQALQVSGLASYFNNNIFSSYEINSWKPEPDLFLFAAKAMGFMPRQCVVVEDSEIGIEAAKAAEMKSLYYVPNANVRPWGNGDTVMFGDMLQLPQLLAAMNANGLPRNR